MGNLVPAWHYVAGVVELIENIRELSKTHPVGKDVGMHCVKCDELCALRRRLNQFELVHPDGLRCEDFARTYHHNRAIAMIVRSSQILMPNTDASGPCQTVAISQARGEVTVGMVRPDVSIVAGSARYFIEVTFTHRTGEAKKLYYRTLGVPVMEIDLSSRYGDNTSDEDLKYLVLEVAAIRRWMVSPQDVLDDRRRKDALDRNDLAFSDRLADTVWAACPEAFQRHQSRTTSRTYGLNGQIDLLDDGPYFPPPPRNEKTGKVSVGLSPHKHPDQAMLGLTGAIRRTLDVDPSLSITRSGPRSRARSDGRSAPPSPSGSVPSEKTSVRTTP